MIGSLKNLAPLLGMAKQQANERALGRVDNRQGNDPHLRTSKPADDLQKLADPILQEDSELPDTRVVASPHRRKIGTRIASGTHRRADLEILRSLQRRQT